MTDTPTVQAWLLLCEVDAALERLAELPREAIDQAHLARIEAQLWAFRNKRAA